MIKCAANNPMVQHANRLSSDDEVGDVKLGC